MIRFSRSVTNIAKSHTTQLKALHSKSTPPQISALGIRSVTRSSRNLVFLKSLGCHVDNRKWMFFDDDENLCPSLDRPNKIDGSVTNSIANNVSLGNFNM